MSPRSLLGVLICRAFAALLVVGAVPLASAASIFEDSFESATMDSTQNGFRWTQPNRVSVVRDDQFKVWGPVAGPMMDGPYSGRQWENAPASDGRHAARFNYLAGQPMSELRFDLGNAYRDLWLRFWLRVPVNFTHPNSSPNNQKLLAVWMDGYEATGDGSTVWLSFFHTSGGNSSFAATTTSGRYTGAKSYEGYVPFISTPEDRGRWMQLVVHLSTDSTAGAADGTVEVWRRWEDEPSFEKTHELRNREIRLPGQGPAGFSAGYIMGWAAGAYAQDTEFLMDDFVVSETSLLDDTSIAQGGDNPLAPVPLVVE